MFGKLAICFGAKCGIREYVLHGSKASFIGLLQMVRGGHRSGRTASHTCCAGNTWYTTLETEVMELELGVKAADDVVTVPVERGSALLFNNLIPHRSLPNLLSCMRWSLDLRFQQTGVEWSSFL